MLHNADVAQLVEHDLAKVGVAGSNPVVRSTKPRPPDIDPAGFFILRHTATGPLVRQRPAASPPPDASALQQLDNLPVPTG